MAQASDLGFTDSDPEEMSFAESAAEDQYTNDLHSDNPAVVARALGIKADKASTLDPSAILQMGRSQVRDYEVRRGNQVMTRDATKADKANAGAPIDKSYMEAQVGPLGTDVQQLKDAVIQSTGSDDRDKQQEAWSNLPKDIASDVANHNPKEAYKKALNYLTLSKRMDALYYGTEGGEAASNIPPAALANLTPEDQALVKGKLSKPKTGPFESQALNLLFDSKNKILPDYLSHADMQALGMAPSTDLGGSPRPSSTPVNRGQDATGNKMFSNTGTPQDNAEDVPLPGMGNKNAPGVAASVGGQPVQPNPYVGTPGMSQPPVGTTGDSPSQVRMINTGSPDATPQGGPPPPTSLGQDLAGRIAGGSPAQAPGQSAQKLRVVLKKTGQIGMIPANEFNPAIYSLAH